MPHASLVVALFGLVSTLLVVTTTAQPHSLQDETSVATDNDLSSYYFDGSDYGNDYYEGEDVAKRSPGMMSQHALRIRRNDGLSHALRVRRTPGSMSHVLRVRRAPNTFSHTLRVRRAPSTFSHALRVKKDARDAMMRYIRQSSYGHALRIKRGDSFKHALRVRRGGSEAGGWIDDNDRMADYMRADIYPDLLNKKSAYNSYVLRV